MVLPGGQTMYSMIETCFFVCFLCLSALQFLHQYSSFNKLIMVLYQFVNQAIIQSFNLDCISIICNIFQFKSILYHATDFENCTLM